MELTTISQILSHKINAPSDAREELIDCSLCGSLPETFLIDSGARANVVSEQAFERLLEQHNTGKIKLVKLTGASSRRLKPYATEAPLITLGEFFAKITIPNSDKPEVWGQFTAVRGGEDSLLSLETAQQLIVLHVGLSVRAITIAPPQTQGDEEFPYVPGELVRFELIENATPTKNAFFHVPLAFQEEAENKLRDMEKKGIIERVREPPEWISGMMAVPKGKSFRLVVCMAAVNKSIKRQFHYLITPEVMQAKLAGAKIFSKLDLSNAFFHLRLAEESKKLTTFMSSIGMFRYKRLLFGVNCAPEIFQSTMERLFAGISGIIIYIDDILIFAKDKAELITRTAQVEEVLLRNNLTVNKDKCESEKESITFLGHRLSPEGINIEESKISTIKNFREPKSISELRSYLGMLSYSREFLKDIHELLAPLRDCLKQNNSAKKDGAPFLWSEEAAKAFRACQFAIINCTLTRGFFDNDLRTRVTTDASPLGLGAVLSQVKPNGDVTIIAFASKSLTSAEANYSQAHKEALAIVWAVEHWRYYLLGREFELFTDAQGIALVFKKSDCSNKRSASRIDSFRLRLSSYSFVVTHITGKNNPADPPSRLTEKFESIEEFENDFDSEHFINLIVEDFDPEQKTLSIASIQSETAKDNVLPRVLEALQTDEWHQELKLYQSLKPSLSIEEGIILNDSSIILPESLRITALELAHLGHPGMTAMKSILRQRVWWPGMNNAVEHFCKSCQSCVLTSQQHPPAPMTRRTMPTGPMRELVIDHNGPYNRYKGCHVIVLVDCYSRYLFARLVNSTDFQSLEAVLCQIFKDHGNPVCIKSDNGPPFTSKEYILFCQKRNIQISHSTPLFPQQNGLAEVYMKIINKAMSIAILEGINPSEALENAAMAHNRAVNRMTDVPPEELFFNRKIIRDLPLWGSDATTHTRADVIAKDSERKARAKAREDTRRRARSPSLEIGDQVVMLKTQNKLKGDTRFDPTPCVIQERKGAEYSIITPSGSSFKRNVTHLKRLPTPQSNSDKGPASSDGHSIHDETEGRPNREKKRPRRLDDYVANISAENLNSKDALD